jgi:CheY-like chemotaxis protein
MVFLRSPFSIASKQHNRWARSRNWRYQGYDQTPLSALTASAARRFIKIFGIYGNQPHRDILSETLRIQMSVTDVLVVDDDVGVCRIVQRMLSNEQCKVQTSQSVADALGAIEQRAFDAYVIDFKLPDGSGLDVAERIRSKWGATPIILISGYDPAAVALRAQKLNISNFLEKPFSREIICGAVSKAIGSPKATPKVSPVDPPVSAMAPKPTKSRFWRR